MTHEQKAKEIVEMFCRILHINDMRSGVNPFAKECAIFYIDGKIECLEKVTGNIPMKSEIINSWTDTDSEIQDWKLVKMEIEKL